jgi:membrane protein implicated in regulation of membrane protease activity
MHPLLLVLPLLSFLLFIFLMWQIALPLSVVILGVSLGVYWKVIQAQRRRPVTGKRAMIGNRAVVVKAEGDEVKVDYEGEIWHASSPEPLQPGQQVIIEAVEGLALRVSPVTDRRR